MNSFDNQFLVVGHNATETPGSKIKGYVPERDPHRPFTPGEVDAGCDRTGLVGFEGGRLPDHRRETRFSPDPDGHRGPHQDRPGPDLAQHLFIWPWSQEKRQAPEGPPP